jgi:hypothetical protein
MQRADNALITEHGVNIFTRPEVDMTHAADEGAQITLGDLHGNAIKLLYPLCRHDIAQISDDDYKTVVTIYTTKTQFIDADDIRKFNEALERIQFNPIAMQAMLRLIGDETGDRGSNDYFTLRILKKIRQANIPLEIILSNHGMEFITACEKYPERKRFSATTMTEHNHTNSLDNMQLLIDKGLITAEEILELYDEIYSPSLKPISYTLSDDETKITYYHHAINNLSVVYALALKHQVPFDDSSPVATARTIDAINVKFKEHVVNKTVHTLSDERELRTAYEKGKNCEINFLTHPYEALMWNRNFEKTPRPTIYNNYKVDYVHGHDSHSSGEDHIFNLDRDNNIGKQGERITKQGTRTIYNNIGAYHAHYSHEHQLGQTVHYRPPVHTPPPLAVAPEEQPPRLVMINQDTLYTLLSEIEDKAEDLFQRLKHEDTNGGSEKSRERLRMAANTASDLHSKLKSHADHYFLYGDNYDTFKNNCNLAITQARPILEQHRGWKQVLGNFGLCVLGVGILYVGACGINKLITGRFLFFQTDSGNKVDNLHKAINVVARRN